MKVIDHKKQSGVVLPTVLWIVMICLVVSTSYSTNVRVNIKILANSKDAMILNYAARSGLYVALSTLLKNNGKYQYGFKGHVFNGVLNDRLLRVKVQPEISDLSINQIDESQINLILTRNGVNSTEALNVAQKIIDWRDKDNQRHPNGMEDRDYYAAGYKYGCKDEVFMDFEELKLVSGVNEQILYVLKQNLTLYPMSANKVIRITSDAMEQDGKKKVRIIAVIQLTWDKRKPYKIIKWSSSSEIL